MKKYSLFALFILVAVAFSSCQVAGDIFKAGMWTTVIIIVVVIAIVIWIVSKLSGRGK